MKTREPHIPLFLWLATAALVHILWGGGAERVADVFEDQTSLARFAASVRRHVDRSNRSLEVTLLDEGEAQPTAAEDPAAPIEPATPEQDEKTVREDKHVEEEDDADAPDALPEDKKRPDEKRDPKKAREPDPKKAKETPKETPKSEPEKPKPEVEKKAPSQPPPEPPSIQIPQRVSVRQHVVDKNQADNPNAQYQADEANRVAQETQSRITSTDQDDPNPTPGLSHLGPDPKTGNAHVTDIAQSESSPGNPNEAPSQSKEDGKDRDEREPAKAQPVEVARAVFGDSARGGRAEQSPAPGARPTQAVKGQTAQPEVEAREAIAEVMTADGPSSVRVAAAQQAQAAQKARKARAAVKFNAGGSSFGGSGAHGRLGLTPGGLDPNLTPLAALETIGSEQLKRERVADGERRRSTHRGSWQTVGLERWRSAIENYIPTAREGNTTALNTARVPFSSYLNQIHNRLHPIFADRFLASLDGLPGDHPANRSGISTNLEIVLDPADGKIVRMGVTKASGTTVFDVNALEAVQRASPFGAAPGAIVSPDGNVYLHWEFHREPNLACSTYFARPKMLRVAPQTAPPIVPVRPATPPEEHGTNHVRPAAPEQSGG